MLVELEKIIPNPMQPRTVFDDDELVDLAETMAADGLLNAISVVGPIEGAYVILDGERRWRAAKLNSWSHIEATVREPNFADGEGDQDLLLLAMIGNVQRSDMGPIDEANGYRKLTMMGMSVVDIAARVGKSANNVYLRLRMLDFPDEVQNVINKKRIPIDERVFQALRRIDAESQIRVAKRAATMKLDAGRILALCSRIENGSSGRNHATAVLMAREHPDEAPALAMNPEIQEINVERFADAVRRACKECGMYDDVALCRSCPLVKFVGLLSKV